MMKLTEVASILNLSCADETQVSSIGIDSRRVVPGQLFVAIRGERLDGHAFIQDAVAQGAIGVVCLHGIPDLRVPQLIVPDTVEALAAIATHHRQALDCHVIALTGSNGKTTVKEMISAILPKPSFATPGNLNNHIGVPLSVLQLQSSHRYAVFELGANHQGEIAHTVSIVAPHVALINNIGAAHIGEFGSIDGIACAKGEIYRGLSKGQVAVINDDDAYAHFWDESLFDKKIVRFSVNHPTTVYARDITFNSEGCAHLTLVTPDGEASLQLKVPGMHTVSNALAAAACTWASNLSLPEIVAGLSRFHGVSGRMTFLKGREQAVIIDDTYNANLRSVLTAIDVLAARKGYRVLVFGDMAELGDWSLAHHEEVGVIARKQGIDKLMTYGQHSQAASRAFGEGASHYVTQQALVEGLKLDAQTTVLVKGSRSSAMEHIVQQLIV